MSDVKEFKEALNKIEFIRKTLFSVRLYNGVNTIDGNINFLISGFGVENNKITFKLVASEKIKNKNVIYSNRIVIDILTQDGEICDTIEYSIKNVKLSKMSMDWADTNEFLTVEYVADIVV